MLFVLICALLGLWLRGFVGMVVGGLIGLIISSLARSALRKKLLSIQSQFLDSTFAVVGALCKADGVVTQDEIRFAEDLFVRLSLSEEQKGSAKESFRRGKSFDFDLDAEIDRFSATVGQSPTLFQMFLQVQLQAIAADGVIHPEEHEMLIRIARRLGLAEAEVHRLEALLRGAASGVADSGPPPREQVEDAYLVLGVSADASDDEVKRAYRKLIIENHPDRLASKGLPESMREMAEERAGQINAAYDRIKKARGTS